MLCLNKIFNLLTKIVDFEICRKILVIILLELLLFSFNNISLLNDMILISCDKYL